MSKKNKMHHLVFSKSGNFANILLFISEQMTNEKLGFANPCTSSYMGEFIRTKSKNINSITDVVIISNVSNQDIIDEIVLRDFIYIPNGNKLSIRHMLPFLIGCNFDINTLSEACRERCNIIEVL